MSASIYTDGSYGINNPGWHERSGHWKAEECLKLLRANNITPATICDVGCGTGAVLDLLTRALGCVGVGFEIASEAHALSLRRQRPGLEFRLDDLIATEDRFELVLAIDVFEHVEDYRGFLRSLRTHGGKFLFHIPLDIHVQGVARATGLSRSHEVNGHLHFFTKETALLTLTDTGYRIMDWSYTHIGAERPELAGSSSFARRLAALPRRAAIHINEGLAVRFLGGSSLLVLCE